MTGNEINIDKINKYDIVSGCELCNFIEKNGYIWHMRTVEFHCVTKSYTSYFDTNIFVLKMDKRIEIDEIKLNIILSIIITEAPYYYNCYFNPLQIKINKKIYNTKCIINKILWYII